MPAQRIEAAHATHSGAGALLNPSGRVEMLSTDFVIGWASVKAGNRFAHIYATVNDEVIGVTVANITRPDLDRARSQGQLNAYAFILLFDRPVPPEQVQSIKVLVVGADGVLPAAKPLKTDRFPTLRVFVMGSPRSGTSQLGETLTKVLNLPWLGEVHGAPLFANAAQALSGDANDKSGLSRYLTQQGVRGVAIETARKAYYYLHGSASFVDKTPGIRMIGAAPFVNECFPGSHFVFLRRHPVSNVMSRLAKFGGNFESHCMDWVGSMNEWLRVKPLLPHFLEIQQEHMLQFPDRIGADLGRYIGHPEHAAAISQSLRMESRERTGAGSGEIDELRSAWTAGQNASFEKICGPVMRKFGYA